MRVFFTRIPAAPPPRAAGKRARSLGEYEWIRTIPFAAVHVAALAGPFLEPTAGDWIGCAVMFVFLMFGVGAGYHRYYSHRAFKTGRGFGFVLAVLAQCTAQRGVLWWAHHHRGHHRHSDEPADIHSPGQWGFWHSHILWVYDRTRATDYSKIADFARYPELVVLNKLWLLPPVLLGVVTYLFMGLSGVCVTFALAVVLVCHSTFAINSLSHIFGKRRFATADDSRNNWLLAIIMMGEGWHNNHHHYQSSARAGFYWWEIDVTYYILRVLAAVGLVWDLRPVPRHVYAAAEAVPSPVVP
jgi:stearoyl-CoA desaturase (delta-9 desaturase)